MEALRTYSCSDGAKVFIEFPRGIRQGEMPPLFVLGPEAGAELVNYRARQNYYVVDRLFAEYVEEHRRGNEADPIEYLRRVEASDRRTPVPAGGGTRA